MGGLGMLWVITLLVSSLGERLKLINLQSTTINSRPGMIVNSPVNVQLKAQTHFFILHACFKLFKMMKYDESMELADKTPCAAMRADLKMCLLESDCCRIKKITPLQCLRTQDPGVPQDCYVLQTMFFECKRSLLDNRTRFRGRKGY